MKDRWNFKGKEDRDNQKYKFGPFFDLEVYMSQIENNALYFSKDLMITDRNMQFMESDFSGDWGDQLLPESSKLRESGNVADFISYSLKRISK